MARKRLRPVPEAAVGVGQMMPKTEAAGGAGGGRPSPLPSRAPIAAVSGSAATEAALAEVTREIADARAQGRLAQALPLDAIEVDHFVRDRLSPEGAPQDQDMEALVASIKARGQQTPIEVVELGNGRYGLLSGWRRLHALRRLHGETGRYETVLAVLRKPADAADAYIAMVEENEIRVGLSYYERARIAMKAVEQGVYPDSRAALRGLFSAASRPKRSKIGAFLPIVAALEGVLSFPAALPERLGLALSKRFEGDPDFAARLANELEAARPDSAAAEQAILKKALGATSPVNSRVSATRIKDAQGQAGSSSSSVPAVRMTTSGEEVVLRGPGVTPDFKIALAEWLNEHVGENAC